MERGGLLYIYITIDSRQALTSAGEFNNCRSETWRVGGV